MRKRQASFELLRIVSILLILCLHYLSHAEGLIEIGKPLTSVRIAGELVESFAIPALNTYILISGFFMSRSGFHFKRFLKIIATVYFYSLGITFVMLATGTYHVNPTDTIWRSAQYLFPIESEHYWFATAYVIMYLFSPVMNMALRHMTRIQMKITILGLLIWFCFLKSIIPISFVTDHKGYDFGWFLVLYLIAGYIRQYDVRLFRGDRNSFLVFAGSSLAIFAMSLGFYLINAATGRFNYYAEVPLHLNFFFTLTGSLGLFAWFRYLKIRENKLADAWRFMGPLVFGVYLLHNHIEIRDRWVGWMEGFFGPVPTVNAFAFLGHMVLSILTIYAAGIVIDWIRTILFAYVARILRPTKFAKWLDSLDAKLSPAKEEQSAAGRG